MSYTFRPTSPHFCKNCGGKYFYPQSGFIRFCSKDCWAQVKVWGSINKTDSCWLWTGTITSSGYARCHGPNNNTLAHRVVWELVIGKIPPGVLLCHDCPDGDNPMCVNPAHHFVGTHADNMADCKNKGRNIKGEKVPCSKLKEFQILEIRELLKTLRQTEIAKMYSVDQSTISYIKSGHIWKFVV